MGRLTASIAHEIRNPLSSINHASQLLAEGGELAPAETRLTEIIRTNASRVDDIIESVLQLSRRAPSQPSVFAGGPWIDQFVAEFCTETGNHVKVKVELSEPHLKLRFDVWSVAAGVVESLREQLASWWHRGGAYGEGRC